MTNDKLRELADALSHQQQADMDGVLCTVSRQAVDEAIAFLRECAAAPTPPAQADVRVPTEAQIDEGSRALVKALAIENPDSVQLAFARHVVEDVIRAALAAKEQPK